MGIEAEFKQVSPYLLEKLREYPDYGDVFFDARYLADSPFWQDFTIDPNDPNDVEWYDEATSYVSEKLEKLKQENPQRFEKISSDIPLIIEEGKSNYLDIEKTWYMIHFVLTGEKFPLCPPFLIGENNEDRLPSINAVLGGTEIEIEATYGLVRYLTDDDVKKVADALAKFSYSTIRERLKFNGCEEDSFDHLFDRTYNPLVKYYKDAAERGNAMFLYLS